MESRETLIRQRFEESISVKQRLLQDSDVLSQISVLAELCIKSLRAGGKIILAGNGGSFADAQHISTEFTSRFMFDRPPLAALTLGTNGSTISALSNDYGSDLIFARELEALGASRDIFIPISTSGISPNILCAVDSAKSMGMVVFGLTGDNPRGMSEICDCIRVPSQETARIQESHIVIGHIVSEIVEAELFPKGSHD